VNIRAYFKKKLKAYTIKTSLLIVFLTSIGNTLYAQTLLTLKCLSVDIMGGTELKWTTEQNIPQFDKFVIFYSKNGNTFSAVDTIFNQNTESYYHKNSHADISSKFYFIKTCYQDTVFSDTLETIYLNLNIKENYGIKEAHLSWNIPNGIIADNPAFSFIILRNSQNDGEGWKAVDTISSSTLSYIKNEITCIDSISYFIKLKTPWGCNFISNTKKGFFKDGLWTAPPEVDSVSVLHSNDVILSWQPSLSIDVKGYIIYRNDITGGFPVLDTVYGYQTTSFVDTSAKACLKPEIYAIAAFDNCGHLSPGTYEKPVKTIYLDVKYQICNERNLLTWTDYINPKPFKYIIYCSENDGPYKIISEIDNGVTYNHKNVSTGTTYKYFIQAVFNKGTSSSCIKTVNIPDIVYIKPKFIHLNNVTITTSNYINLNITVDTVPSFIKVIRSEPNNNIPDETVRIYNNSISPLSSLTITDFTANVSAGYYVYRIDLLDSCKHYVLSSNSLKTIFLKLIANVNSVTLEWNIPEGMENYILEYEIFRQEDNTEPESPLIIIPAGGQLSYQDNNIPSSPELSELIYWVKAIKSTGEESSYSNRALISEQTKIYMPNAFKPGGFTPILKPVGKFGLISYYKYRIYNREGTLIFETSNPNDGWDGTYKGKTVPQGTYVYIIEYHPGTFIKGTVTIIY
jgi:gliding motility-associated-like protein